MVRRHSDRRLALETDPDVTNREKAARVLRVTWTFAVAGRDPEERYGEDEIAADTATIESALNAERKAGEIDGQIKTLEWVRRAGDDWRPFTIDTITAELDRLRAEKAKLE